MAAALVETVTARAPDAVHAAPVWRSSADFIIGCQLAEGNRAEQLWARQLSDRRFQVCCIPFFIHDVALGDIVETDGNYNLVAVAESAGRFVFRVWFGGRSRLRDKIADDLVNLGALLEWSSTNLLAVDAADQSQAQRVADYLAEAERQGYLEYETGRSS